MRTLLKIVFIGLFLVSGIAPTIAGEEEKQALILEVLHLTNVMDMFETMKKSTGDQLEANLKAQAMSFTAEQIEATKEIMFEVFDEIRPDLVLVIIKLHNDNYSEDELQQLVAFYKTDLGQMFLEKVPQITTQTLAETSAIIQRLQPELQRRIQKKFEEMAELEQGNKS